MVTEEITTNAGFTPDVIPEVPANYASKDSHTGVSTNYTPTSTTCKSQPSVHTSPLTPDTSNLTPETSNLTPNTSTPTPDTSHPTPNTQHLTPNTYSSSWFVLRATYGRENIASQYLTSKGITVFYPTIKTKKLVKDKLKNTTESMLPNIFFAWGTFDQLKEYVYDNTHDETKHLRFYYARHHDGTKEPLTVPEKQMRSLMIICGTESGNIIIQPDEVEKFKEGQRVIVKEGDFKGVEGVVARYHGQQRVGIIIDGLLTATTAYIPTAFLKVLD